jgi:hypothetical protein
MLPQEEQARAAVEEFLSALLTRKKLVEKLDVSVRTVDDWRERQIIPYLKIGGVVRFELTQVMAALRQRYEVKEKARAAR